MEKVDGKIAVQSRVGEGRDEEKRVENKELSVCWDKMRGKWRVRGEGRERVEGRECRGDKGERSENMI